MKRTKEDFDNLSKEDIYSLMLFALYKVKDVPEYSTLSELAYILDKQSLLNFLEYYGGTTITIPKLTDLKTITNALLLYEYINLRNETLGNAVKLLGCKDYELDAVRSVYYKLCKVLSRYDFTKK